MSDSSEQATNNTGPQLPDLTARELSHPQTSMAFPGATAPALTGKDEQDLDAAGGGPSGTDDELAGTTQTFGGTETESGGVAAELSKGLGESGVIAGTQQTFGGGGSSETYSSGEKTEGAAPALSYGTSATTKESAEMGGFTAAAEPGDSSTGDLPAGDEDYNPATHTAIERSPSELPTAGGYSSNPGQSSTTTAPTGISASASGEYTMKIPSVQPEGIPSAPVPANEDIGSRRVDHPNGPPGGDYEPDHSDPNVYTSPQGYSTTSSTEPTTSTKLPLSENVKHVPEGGVALHGKEGLPMGSPNFVDRMVGKTQQEIGKQTENWSMYEKGVLREAGGAAAAKGEARAPL